jgi:hypothetical protein
VCSETVEDHDRRFWHRWPLTWRSSHAFTVLNTTQFHAECPSADLARRKSGVQIPSPPPTLMTIGNVDHQGRCVSGVAHGGWRAPHFHRPSHGRTALLGRLRVERRASGEAASVMARGRAGAALGYLVAG